MHTSSILTASDFTYRLITREQTEACDFSAFCPGYHEQDRVGVVTLHPEDGIRHCGIAMLAITTSFYDTLRGRYDEFFDYPQHFAIIDAGPVPQWGPIGSAWGWIDVWPNTNWIASGGNAYDMLHQVFRYQINCLFWPESLQPNVSGNYLPGYARQLLSRRLKSVLYYHTENPSLEIQGTASALVIVSGSLDRLGSTICNDRPPHSVQRFRSLTPTEFLDDMTSCFES